MYISNDIEDVFFCIQRRQETLAYYISLTLGSLNANIFCEHLVIVIVFLLSDDNMVGRIETSLPHNSKFDKHWIHH